MVSSNILLFSPTRSYVLSNIYILISTRGVLFNIYAGSWSASWIWIWHYCAGSPMTGSLGVFNSDLFSISLQQFLNYSSGFPTTALVPEMVSACESLLWQATAPCVQLCLSHYGGSDLPCALSHRFKKSCCIFSLFSFYLFVKIK